MTTALANTSGLVRRRASMARVAERILVVEDDDRIRAMLRLALEDEGYEIEEAANGESGVEAMRGHPADFMIVDVMLGGMDGYECIRQVRRSSAVPIIVVSARSDTHDVVAGLEAGADDYVTKPFQIKEITARLRALRRRSRMGAEAPVHPERDEVVLDSGPDGELVLSPAAGTLHRGA